MNLSLFDLHGWTTEQIQRLTTQTKTLRAQVIKEEEAARLRMETLR